MGIVNIDDALHDQIRLASGVTGRSMNAQAGFWIKIGMLSELNPTKTFNEIVAQELRAAGWWRPCCSWCEVRRWPRAASMPRCGT